MYIFLVFAVCRIRRYIWFKAAVDICWLLKILWVKTVDLSKTEFWENLMPQSRPQSPSLLRMTEGEKSSGEPWNMRLSYWFSRKTKNTHLIGSFYFARKWKVCLVLLSAGAVDYKYARKEKLFGAILFINFSGIKRHLTNEKPVTCRSLLVEPLAHSFFFFWETVTTVSIIDFCTVFNLKLLSLPALVKAKSNVLLNNEAIF